MIVMLRNSSLYLLQQEISHSASESDESRLTSSYDSPNPPCLGPKLPLFGQEFLLLLSSETYSIRLLIMSLTIVHREKMKIPANVIDQLVAGAQSDIRQVVNMLSTWKLSNDSMTFDEGKELYVSH